MPQATAMTNIYRALNLSQLAKHTGYSRAALSAMQLPLIAGKNSVADFRRIIRRRQDAMEAALPAPILPPRDALTPDDVTRVQALANKLFYAPHHSKAQPTPRTSSRR